MAALVLQAAGVCLVSAQDQGATTNAAPVNAPAPGAGKFGLTPDEYSHWKKVEKQTLEANPDLKTEHDNLAQQRQDLDDQGANASPDARKALMTQWHDYMQKVRAAALKIDPTLADIFAKMDAWRAQHAFGGKPAAGTGG